MAGSSGSKTISFTLEPSFIQRIGSRDVVFIVEYYANSANEYSFSYTSDSAVKTLEYEMGTANTWSGKNIRVSDFKPGSGLDGSHFKIELGSALKQMRIASMKVVLVEKETTKYPHIVETDYDTNGYVVAEENVKYYGRRRRRRNGRHLCFPHGDPGGQGKRRRGLGARRHLQHHAEHRDP